MNNLFLLILILQMNACSVQEEEIEYIDEVDMESYA
jgi:hypothetical protein